MTMRTTLMAERTRWLIASGLMFTWFFGNSARELIRAGYGVGGWPWWLLAAATAAVVSLATGWISILTARPVIATQREAVAGLDDQQLKQVARAWKRGPVPGDPEVLVAVLRRRDLSEHYRRRTLRLRLVIAVIIGAWAFVSVLTRTTGQRIGTTVLILALWAVCLLALFRPEIRTRLRRHRLMQLRAAADQDRQISAAIADPVTPAPRPKWRWWMVAYVVVIALAYGGLFGAAYYFSPKQRSCKAAQAVVHEIYANRDWFWTTNIGPTGRPLADYQHLAQQLHDKATAAAGFPEIAPHARRIAELADQASVSVSTARQQIKEISPDTLGHNQSEYVRILDEVANEEKPLTQACH